MGRPPITGIVQDLNSVLKRTGVRYRLKTTNQTPKILIKALDRFEDGKTTKSSGLPTENQADWQAAFDLCVAMSNHEKPLTLLKAKQKFGTDSGGLTGWDALAQMIIRLLDERGTQWRGQATQTHLRQLQRLGGNVSSDALLDWVEEVKGDARDRPRRLNTLNLALDVLPDLSATLDNFRYNQIRKSTTFSRTTVVNPRELPSDPAIEQFIDQITNPQWRTAMGLIAVYGLRPHEIFCIDEQGIGDDEAMEVHSKKTGLRLVFPKRLDWTDRWDLRKLNLPEVCRQQSGKELGKRVTTNFARLRDRTDSVWREKAVAYDLRHAYAGTFHTTSQFDYLSIREVANYMGHSEKVHLEIYTRWIDRRNLRAQAARRYNNNNNNR